MGQEKIQEEQREVARCQTLLTNRAEFQRIRKKVEEAENAGISPSLSKSTLTNSHSRPATTTCPIAKSFGTVERHQVDILIVRALCTNGIPFNVLRNPDFLAMLKGVNQAPEDYKPPSFDQARTTLVDECQRELEKELITVKDTWTTHETSIVFDGWTNVKWQPLINVVESNSSGSMFMYAKDFTGQEKTGANIAEFLLESIEEVRSSNVLQVITGNVTNSPGGIARRAPNQDREVVAGVLKAFDRIGEDENEKAELRKQLAKFQNKQGLFGTAHARIDATTMTPISWWSTYGSENPELAEIAIRVLSQPISSSSAERVWSTYSYIHNIKRNRLNAKCADKLVFIHSNIRLLSRFTTSYKEGPCKKWDIDPGSTYVDDSTVRLEDLRWVD
ncbi:hypothetical protein V6N11_018992 [Hibiscus sabdariffa]|uniref:HAT C-terminal dimerisation domain-containing protein n=1 Tax=Hibiscus sabdariffa TaxID=183260 RepID=A0ABR2R108_9ROSI